MSLNNKIDMVSVEDISGFEFFIPKYQRGYRWNRQQVTDLLIDLYDYFIVRKETTDYSLQPLVVKRRIKNYSILKGRVNSLLDNTSDSNLCINELEHLISKECQWEVIDGQQRLTTLFIMLKVLNLKIPFDIEYQTRPQSKDFLNNYLDKIGKSKESIDYYHMHKAYVAIKGWEARHKLKHSSITAANDELIFLRDCLMKRVKFIWYESVGEDPIKVFTRINIGKIGLTNAELIRALFLNCTNFKGESLDSLHLLQLNIAKKWDEIEYSLQKKDFWLFLSDTSVSYYTHIDFIFKLISSQNMLELEPENLIQTGQDNYSVYRYFSIVITNKIRKQERNAIEEINDIWNTVVNVYNTFTEWFNDEFLYHYIGFLLWNCEKDKSDKFKLIQDLIEEWKKKSKKQFLKDVKEKIKNEIINCKADEVISLDFEKHKSKIFKILLLHNIQSVLATLDVQQQSKYEMNVFYKFPFHLFKSESWNVEHIDSATSNELKSLKEKKAWAHAILDDSSNRIKRKIRRELKNLINSPKYDDVTFKKLYDETMEQVKIQDVLLTSVDKGPDCPEDNERMHIWNLALLDERTNKSYHNYLFSLKREFVINKEKGNSCHLNDNGRIVVDGRETAFVPPCTKQVFLKYYTNNSNNLLNWGKTDAKAYLEDIKEQLKDFLK